jgi:hypothetical protein
MRPAGLPRRITICGHEYTIKTFPDGKVMVDGLESTDEALGACNADMGLIVLRDLSGQSPSQLRDSLLHEIMHACTAGSGLRAKGGALAWERNGSKEEQVVRVLATALLDALRRNPNLAQFLLKR